MKTKVWFAMAVLSYVSVAVCGSKGVYPNERVAEFVVAKLDVNSLPSAFRPRKEKEKKRFADYGFTAQRVDENKAILEGTGGAKRLAIKILG